MVDVSLNIKNERVHELARRAAAVTGKSQTGAVEEALRLLLESHASDGTADPRTQRLEQLRAISLAWNPGSAEATAVADVDDLYDDATGLPR